MNLNKIKKKLESMQTQKTNKYADLLWRPKIGKYQIRIVPAKWDKEYPFKELFFHYNIGTKPMLALTNFGEEDPIQEFSNKLKKQEYSVENWKLAKKLEPKMRVFVPVVVREEEEKGVRLWGFGKEIYNELLALAEDDDIGDYTNILQGRDFIVEIAKQEGKQFNDTSIRIKTKTTPLSENASKVKEWQTQQPDPLEVFDRVEYSELKQALVNALSPETNEAGEGEEEDATATTPKLNAPSTSDLPWKDEDQPTPKPSGKDYTLSTANKKPSIDEDFKKLFPED